MKTRRAPRRTTNRPSDDELLEAACEVFGQAGFHGASMDAIAERANSTKPTLYAHFGSKDALYEACLRREAAKFTESVTATLESAVNFTVAEQVNADVKVYFEYGAAHPNGFRLLFDTHASGPADEIRSAVLSLVTTRTADVFRAAHARRGRPVPGPSADMLAAMVVGATIAGARHALLVQGIDPALAGEFAASFSYSGMRHFDRDLMTSIDAGIATPGAATLSGQASDGVGPSTVTPPVAPS